MKIIGTLENVDTGAIELTESESADYRQGFDVMQRLLQEGFRLLSVQVER